MNSPRGRILCTEDDSDTRDLIITMLSLDGYDVLCSENGEEALKLARTGKFDLYIIDNWLPDIPGPKLTARIREFDSKTPILFYSGAGYAADKEAARQAGAQSYLVKPIDTNLLLAEVDRLISQHSS